MERWTSAGGPDRETTLDAVRARRRQTSFAA